MGNTYEARTETGIGGCHYISQIKKIFPTSESDPSAPGPAQLTPAVAGRRLLLQQPVVDVRVVADDVPRLRLALTLRAPPVKVHLAAGTETRPGEASLGCGTGCYGQP